MVITENMKSIKLHPVIYCILTVDNEGVMVLGLVALRLVAFLLRLCGASRIGILAVISKGCSTTSRQLWSGHLIPATSAGVLSFSDI